MVRLAALTAPYPDPTRTSAYGSTPAARSATAAVHTSSR